MRRTTNPHDARLCGRRAASVRDDGVCMNRKLEIPAILPDASPLRGDGPGSHSGPRRASPRRDSCSMIDSLVEQGAMPGRLATWIATTLSSATDTMPPPAGSVPWQDTEPDEVCLASSSTAAADRTIDAGGRCLVSSAVDSHSSPLTGPARPGSDSVPDSGHRSSAGTRSFAAPLALPTDLLSPRLAHT